MKKKVFLNILSEAFCCFAFIVFIPSVFLTIDSYTSYDSFYVEGDSMYPTLQGDSHCSYYGTMDKTKKAINKVKRFDIVSVYYPFESSDYKQPYVRNADVLEGASRKIKRVIGLPGDTLNFNNYSFTISHFDDDGKEVVEYFDTNNLPFHRHGEEGENDPTSPYKIIDRYTSSPITLHEDEYFVCGDNWTMNASLDSLSTKKCIYKENILGVMVKVTGTCEIHATYKCPHCNTSFETIKPKKGGSIKCENCSITLTSTSMIEEKIANKQKYKKAVYYL